MNELLHNLMHPLPNGIMTVIMGVLVVYWLVSFVFGGMELDFDVDFDANIDIDAGLDIDSDGIDARSLDTGDPSTHVEPGAFIKFLEFVNVGKMPFMVIFTIFMFFIWTGSLLLTSIFGMSSWGEFSVLILIPLTFVAVFLTKLTTKPLIKVFNAMGYKGEERIDFLGRSGKMTSTIQDDKIGSAELLIDGNPIRLNVKSLKGDKISYGEFITIEDESPDKKFYLVSKELSLRNIN